MSHASTFAVPAARGDRWTTVPIDPNQTHLNGNPFVVQVVWGPQGEVQIASDNALADLFGLQGYRRARSPSPTSRDTAT